MKTAKEVTINYLKSIRKDRENANNMLSPLDGAGIKLENEIYDLSKAIKIVEESEGE